MMKIFLSKAFVLAFLIFPVIVNAQKNPHYFDGLINNILQYENEKGIDSGYYELLDKLKNNLKIYKNKYGIDKIYLTNKGFYADKIVDINYKESIGILNDLIYESRKRGYTKVEASIVSNLAKIYLAQGKSKMALEMFIKNAGVFKKMEDWNAYGYTLIDIGNAHYNSENYERARFYYHKAVKVFSDHFKDKDLAGKLAVGYQNLGLAYFKEQQTDSARYFFLRALYNRKKSGQTANYSLNYSYLANLYSELENRDSTEYYIFKAIESDKQLGQVSHLTISYILYIQFLIEQKRYKEAKTIALKNYHYALKNSFKAELIPAASNLAQSYYLLGKLDSALYYTKISAEKAREINKMTEYSTGLKHIITILKKMNRPELTPEYYDELLRVKDELSANSALKMQMNLEMEQLKYERQMFEAKAKKQKTVTLFLSVIIFLVLIISAVIIRTEIKLKKSNERLKRALDELQMTTGHLNKTYSIIAHDLKGPIGGVLNLIELLRDNSVDPEDSRNFINVSYKTLSQSYTLLLNLLNWSRLQGDKIKYNPKELNVLPMAEVAIDLHRHLIDEKSIRCNINIEPHLKVFADKNVLMTTLRNLINNAIKYTPESGNIEIAAEENDGKVKIRVIDSGVGMSSQQIKNIFKADVYESSVGTNHETGSGLGLKLIIDMIKQNNGEIQIDSKQGKGTVVEVIFPTKSQEGNQAANE